MTTKKIIKALKYCADNVCDPKCPVFDECFGDGYDIELKAADRLEELENELKSVKAESVKRGEWIPDDYGYYCCSECGCRESLTPYCPSCGARMDGDDEQCK